MNIENFRTVKYLNSTSYVTLNRLANCYGIHIMDWRYVLYTVEFFLLYILNLFYKLLICRKAINYWSVASYWEHEKAYKMRVEEAYYIMRVWYRDVRKQQDSNNSGITIKVIPNGVEFTPWCQLVTFHLTIERSVTKGSIGSTQYSELTIDVL